MAFWTPVDMMVLLHVNNKVTRETALVQHHHFILTKIFTFQIKNKKNIPRQFQ